MVESDKERLIRHKDYVQGNDPDPKQKKESRPKSEKVFIIERRFRNPPKIKNIIDEEIFGNNEWSKNYSKNYLTLKDCLLGYLSKDKGESFWLKYSPEYRIVNKKTKKILLINEELENIKRVINDGSLTIDDCLFVLRSNAPKN